MERGGGSRRLRLYYRSQKKRKEEERIIGADLHIFASEKTGKKEESCAFFGVHLG